MELFRLNPFEIRAGLEPFGGFSFAPLFSLNPFEIRAGLERILTWVRWVYKVLIPLKSGQVWNCVCVINHSQMEGLNPFEIRAGLERKRRGS